MDIILGVLDCTLESISIARRMDKFCKQAGVKEFWLIVNKIESEKMKSLLMENLGGLKDKVVGSISYDQELVMAGLLGNILGECKALIDIERVVERLEQTVSFRKKTK